MTTYLLKLNCELHLGGAEPRPSASSDWENIRITFPNPSTISGGSADPVKDGDSLVIWAHEDPGFGSGLGLTAEGVATSVVSTGETTSATLSQPKLLTPHYKLRAWPGGSSGSAVIDYLLRNRHLGCYQLSENELAELRATVDKFVAAKLKQLSTTAYMSEEEKALLADQSSILAGFERRFTLQETRPEQAVFRADLMKLYKGRCAISKCPVPELLDAAHIVPFSESVALRNDTSNGLILRTDLHRLFDKLLLSVHPMKAEVLISPVLQKTVYQQFNGRKVAHFAASEFLREQYKRFKAHVSPEDNDTFKASPSS